MYLFKYSKIFSNKINNILKFNISNYHLQCFIEKKYDNGVFI